MSKKIIAFFFSFAIAVSLLSFSAFAGSYGGGLGRSIDFWSISYQLWLDGYSDWNPGGIFDLYVNGGGRKTFQELYEDYLSTLPSITVSSSDVSTSTSSIYSYNGVELPALPDWDQEAYPYACIVRSWSGSYCFIATKSPAYVRNSTTASRSNDLVLDWDSNSMRCFLASDGLSWGIPSLSTVYGDVLFYSESSGNDIFMWANYDVYYGSPLYLAASDPVPAGGVYTECNVPKLTGSTDFPGFAACLKDATTPAHEEAAASFRTADKAFSFGIELWGADSETGEEQKAATLLFTVRE